MGTEFHRLGNYIREVNVRNRELKVTRLLGVGLEKKFFPSIANIIGTDLSNYKVIKRGQFGCKFMSVGRDGILPVSILEDDDPAIISSAYYAFEVKDPNILMPDHLMMYLRRPEFDRELWFYSGGDVRGGVNYSDFCDMPIYVPDIERQREIVSEYETLTRRIRLNEQMIEKLEATAQALYRHTFVDNIDKQNLPQGWHLGTIGDFCKEMKSGGTPNRNCNEFWNKKDYPWLKTGEVQNNVIFDTEEYISQAGLDNSSAKLIPRGSVIMAMYGATAAQVAYLECDTTTNQACCNMICHSKNDAAFLFFHLLSNQDDIKKLANGGAQENLSQELIAQQPILLFDDNEKKRMFVPVLDNLIVKYKENIKLNELRSLHLAKMGQ